MRLFECRDTGTRRSLEMVVWRFGTKSEDSGEIGNGDKNSPGTRNVSPYTSSATEN